MESDGWDTWKVERRVPVGGNFRITKSIDLFNIIDMVAIRDGVLRGVQVCGADYSPHITKMTEEHEDNTRLWLSTGAELFLVGWRQLVQYNKDGTKSKRKLWTPRIAEFKLESDEIIIFEP